MKNPKSDSAQAQSGETIQVENQTSGQERGPAVKSGPKAAAKQPDIENPAGEPPEASTPEELQADGGQEKPDEGETPDVEAPQTETAPNPGEVKEVIPEVVIRPDVVEEKSETSAVPETAVPSFDLDAPLKIDEASGATQIPTVDPNADLKIDKVKDAGESIPDSDMNAHLKVEEAKFTEDTTQASSNKSLFIIGGVVGLVFILAAIAFFFFVVKNQKVEEREVVPVESEQMQHEEESAGTFDRSKWSLEVLNGSGVAGLAKTSADKLVGLGYKIIKVGNSSKSNVTVTEILVSEELSEKSEDLLKDISDNFKQATISGALKDSTASARIIVGSD